MENDGRDSNAQQESVVELTRVQPIEAEVIVARLRSAGINATVGADSVYPSLSFADGVPIFVSERDRSEALALLEAEET